MVWLKQSTSTSVSIGPFVDPADGVTELTGLTITVRILKHGGSWANRNSAGAIAHQEDGWYSVPLDTTDTNTLGPLIIKVSDPASHLPVWGVFAVMGEVSYAVAPTPPTVAAIRTEIDSNSTKLDAAISTRLSTAGYTAPTTPPTAIEIATAVWANATRTLTSFGSLVTTIWANVSRTLTSGGGGGGATAQEVWEYARRVLTNYAPIFPDPYNPAKSSISLFKGDSYTVAAGRELVFTNPGGWPDLAGATFQFTITLKGTAPAAAIDAEGTLSGLDVTVELTAEETDVLTASRDKYVFILSATLTGGDIVTLSYGIVNII